MLTDLTCSTRVWGRWAQASESSSSAETALRLAASSAASSSASSSFRPARLRKRRARLLAFFSTFRRILRGARRIQGFGVGAPHVLVCKGSDTPNTAAALYLDMLLLLEHNGQ